MAKLLILLLLLNGVVHTQFHHEKSSKRAGSAFELRGTIHILIYFITDPNNNWEYDEKIQMLHKLDASNRWLTHQAKKYGATVQFRYTNYDLHKDVEFAHLVPGKGTGEENVEIVSSIIHKTSSLSPLELLRRATSHPTIDQAIVLAIAKGKGTSYSMPYRNHLNKEKYFFEGAIIYEHYWSGQELAASTFTHEILHLFGAWDLYNTYAQTAEKESKAKELFPNSIMLRTAYDITTLNIDSLTAWRIGWNSSPQAWYSWFKPEQYKHLSNPE